LSIKNRFIVILLTLLKVTTGQEVVVEDGLGIDAFALISFYNYINVRAKIQKIFGNSHKNKKILAKLCRMTSIELKSIRELHSGRNKSKL